MFTINFSDSKFKNNYVKKMFNTKGHKEYSLLDDR